MIGASPPGPFKCGSATCKVKAVAQAASNALPPRSSTAMPVLLASQWVLATTPKVPAISGRVVNMGVLRRCVAEQGNATLGLPEAEGDATMLVLVVGPSGAGKDSLLNGARAAFAGDARVHFVRRVITRPADPEGEDHEPVTEAEFDART